MTEAHTKLSTRNRGFTSISRCLIDASTGSPEDQENNNHLINQRHRYLIAREAILIGILAIMFLLTAVAGEFTSRWNSWLVFISIPFVTFLALHILCLLASQLAKIAKPFLIGKQLWSQDLAQGVTIITIFTVYAVFRIIHPVSGWFTPIAWVWIGIWAIDCIGRGMEFIMPKPPAS